MKPTLFVIAGAVAILVTISAIRAIRKPEPAAVLQLAGIILLLVTVLIHFAEALSLLPRMGLGAAQYPRPLPGSSKRRLGDGSPRGWDLLASVRYWRQGNLIIARSSARVTAAEGPL